MIIALTAIGEEGQYGSSDTKNGLPWDCPQELAYYYETLERLMGDYRTTSVLIGGKTWSMLPPPVRSTTLAMMLRNKVENLYIYDPREKYVELVAETNLMVMGKYLLVRRLLTIGKNFGKHHETNTICLGGATLIRNLLSQKLLDEAYVSRIRLNREHPTYVKYKEAEHEFHTFFNENESVLDNCRFAAPELRVDEEKYHPIIQRYEKLNQACVTLQKELLRYLQPRYNCTNLDELLLTGTYAKEATVLALPTILKSDEDPLYVTTEHWNFND